MSSNDARFFMDGWDVRVYLSTRHVSPRWVVEGFAPDGNCYLQHSCSNKYPTQERIGNMLVGAAKRYAEATHVL